MAVLSRNVQSMIASYVSAYYAVKTVELGIGHPADRRPHWGLILTRDFASLSEN